MFKRNAILLISTILLLFSLSASAQLFSFDSSKKSGGTNSANTTSSPSTTVLSPDEFSKQVAQINTQNQAQSQTSLKKQLNQNLSQVPPPKLSMPPAAAAPSTQSSPPAEAPTHATETKPDDDSFTTTPSTDNDTTTQASPPPSVPANNAQSKPYTGFQSGGSQSSTSGQTKSSGGWNVRY